MLEGATQGGSRFLTRIASFICAEPFYKGKGEKAAAIGKSGKTCSWCKFLTIQLKIRTVCDYLAAMRSLSTGRCGCVCASLGLGSFCLSKNVSAETFLSGRVSAPNCYKASYISGIGCIFGADHLVVCLSGHLKSYWFRNPFVNVPVE